MLNFYHSLRPNLSSPKTQMPAATRSLSSDKAHMIRRYWIAA